MKISFYGKLADPLGREMDMPAEGSSTVGALREAIVARHPEAELSLHDRRVRACIRGQLVADDHQVEAADDVEFLAPVSGG